ncbi:hypothetical protein OQA88_13060 [Cercophora sp. LCS_1]
MPYTLTIKQIPGKPGQVYYPLQLNTVPNPSSPPPGHVLVKISAAALNHRDLFIRQHLYPGISFSSPLLADGYGTVIQPSTHPLYQKAVILTPSRGWQSDPAGPEDQRKHSVIGGAQLYSDQGTAQEYVTVPEDEVVLAPEHLSPAEAAALPLVGVTGWRALVTKAGITEGTERRNVLITGIGGGVALQTLQFAVAMGNVDAWVTSGDNDKIERAKKMGAKGGVIYKEEGWEKKLGAMLPRDRPFLDAVVDGAGGDVVAKSVKLLRPGGVIANYGMTTGNKMDWVAMAFLRNVELKGTSMGSRKEFGDMVEFVRKKGIRPVVSRTVRGLDNLEGIEGLFEEMKQGRQFGKLVVLFDGEGESPKL